MNTKGFASLFAALSRLDRILERATRAADATYGASAAADPYRGLYIAPEDVPRMLAREPGTPLLSADPAADNPEWERTQLLGRRFGLDSFDCDVILLALAPEIDLRYERLYAYLQDDVTRRRPSVDLALNLLCATRDAKLAARERFAPASPLIGSKLIHLIPEGSSAAVPPLLAHTVKVDESVLRFLLDHPRLDLRLSLHSEWIDRADIAALRGPVSGPLLARLAEMTRDAEEARRPLRLFFEGPPQSLKRNTALGLAERLGRPLIVCDLARMPQSGQQFQDALALVFREARLHKALVHFEEVDALFEHRVLMTLLSKKLSAQSAEPDVVTLEGERSLRLRLAEITRIPFPEPEYPERLRAWQEELTLRDLPASAAPDLAAVYRLGPDDIREAAVAAREQARLTGQPADDHDVRVAAQAQACRELGPMAQRLAPVSEWDALVLPPDQVSQLREIAAHARYSYQVYGEWGFSQKLALGKGLSALFSGPPGTGKTMAAEVIANELYLDLYRIDLSQVVSKYIGETEKNLATVFREARAGSCILFFDECDALFGKRTETKDAHDRYANIEIAYLLQKIDEYEGLCILATNLRQNLDPAFVRRLTFIVEFPFPDAAHRRKIWGSIWPQRTPRAGDLDLDFVARQFKLSGGAVKNAAVGAAFMAAAERSADIGTTHLLRAIRREIEKSGHALTRVDLGPYADRPELAALLGVAADTRP